MALFSWLPDVGATYTPRINMIEIKFGDSYSQRQQIGMNAINEDWSLNFANRSESEALAIDNFLKSRGGVESFDFVPPGALSPIKVICKSGSWSLQRQKGSNYTINAKFEQVYEP